METKKFILIYKKLLANVANAKTKEEVMKVSTLFYKVFGGAILIGDLPVNASEEFDKEKIKKLRSLEKKMTYSEFKKLYIENNKRWNFDLFEIKCKKCGSSKVEFNSDMELESGYYDDYYVEGKMIVKCHNCGNAFTLDVWELEK